MYTLIQANEHEYRDIRHWRYVGIELFIKQCNAGGG